MPRVRYVALGRIGRPHGVRGEVRVDPGAGPAVDYGRYRRFFLARSGEPRPVQVEGVRPHGRLALFKFRGVDDPEAAKELTGSILYVERADMPALGEDEYYHVDLVGCGVVDEEGRLLGTVDDVFPTGAHDVLVIASDSGPWMLPVVGETVLEVDPEGGLIRVRVPGGLPA